MWIIVALGAMYIIAVLMFFNVANMVYNTALFVYAEKGKIPTGFNERVIKGAYTKKQTSE